MIVLFAWVVIGTYVGIKVVERMYPVNPPERMESGSILLVAIVAWPLFLLIWIMGTLFDKTSNY